MSDFLARMADASLARVIAAQAREPEHVLERRALLTPHAPRLELQDDGFDLFAEIKPRSPAAGPLAPGGTLTPAQAATRARAYAEGGAAAISVLTEPSEFGGSLDHLAAVADAVDVPVMRKDFVVDAYQLLEARAAGARGVLLIARLHDAATLTSLAAACEDLDLFCLIECFDAADCAKVAFAATLDPVLIGLNCRDLATLQVVPSRLAELRPALPGTCHVAESGCETPEDCAAVARLGYDAALVGSALMRAPDPAATVRRMLAAGRAARRPHAGRAPQDGRR
jgi:indole-3-glycerol phosphate synthase